VAQVEFGEFVEVGEVEGQGSNLVVSQNELLQIQ